MQKSTQIKLILKNILPSFLFEFIKSTWQYVFVPMQNILYKNKIKSFTSPEFINLNYKNINFDLLIDPSNGLVDTSIYAKRKYEHHILDQMYKYIKSGDTVLDIGANIGHHTIFMATLLKNKALETKEENKNDSFVYAFEPIPKIYTQLEKSITKNNLNNIRLEKYALGQSETEEIINITSSNVGGSSILNKNQAAAPDLKNKTENIKIQVKTLDSLELQKVDFIKLDVEGYEWNVIDGGRETIIKNKPVIIFEYSPDYFRKAGNDDGSKILNFMSDNNYIMYDLENKEKEIANIADFEKEFSVGLRSQTNVLCLQK